MPSDTPAPPANNINWKKAFLITLPLATLALLATAICPRPIVTIAPYDGTIIEGANVDDRRSPTDHTSPAPLKDAATSPLEASRPRPEYAPIADPANLPPGPPEKRFKLRKKNKQSFLERLRSRRHSP